VETARRDSVVTHDITEITEAEEGALPGQVILSI
jgi:hypothetical protein